VWEIVPRVNIALFKQTGGRVGGRFFGAPVLLLHHVGRKSGQKRVSPLIYVADGDDLVLVASKGGAERNPAWFHNLVAAGEAEVELPGGERRRVRARLADDAERERLWPRCVEVYRPYASYQRSTDRRIPLVILTPSVHDG
jgi:deazaflavin-dependent oxidoreductase (nitroreductase family)